MKFNMLNLFLLFSFFTCSNIEITTLLPSDIKPPELLSLIVTAADTLEIIGTEPISLELESFYSQDQLVIIDQISNNNNIKVVLAEKLIPGREYKAEFKIVDSNYNSLSFIAKFYGYNNRLPEIIINEFTCKGSNTNPNKIELFIKSGGNLAGLSIYNGVKENYDYLFVFPSIEVKSGEYLVFRTISERYPKAFIEIESLSVNNDSKFIDGVRDIRADNFKLSSTNGVISLYSNPFGYIIDALPYSKNLNDDSKNYRNFGLKKSMDRIDLVGESGFWKTENVLILINQLL